ncbi:hypothetical protein EI165_08445 [Pseudoalteromonas nigrifaciens]|uniref:DUF6283 family protein n=1 Tax=Pseudoalteromonas nigrifaciens TaxID=28109 RepID=UPI001787F891|nr:DUF6283 family protein [Pseudoalteromonas nigrifaciens]MBE0420152.1 hypothetical protein [Pseudoalteromonas nigrifaciens]
MASLPNVKKPCGDCPFRKDTLNGWLGAERMTEILDQQSFVCHKKNHLQCAGHMLMKGESNSFVRLAGRLNIKLDLSGKDLVFDSNDECIDHHSF